jgi:hypothetical protein
MSTEPIKTIEQAKEFFIKMDGSPYEMAREYPQRYDEYRQLNISKQTELEWREELLEKHFDSIKESKDAGQIWTIYSNMYRVFENLKTSTALEKMLETTQYIRDKAPMKNRVIIAEYINGLTARSTRQGLIYIAYDSNNISAAKAFIELSLHFSAYDGQDRFGIERSQKAARLCNEIKAELGL